MGFVLGTLFVWGALWAMSRRPLEVWLPVGFLGGLVVLQILHRWTDYDKLGGRVEGALAGLATWLIVREITRRRRSASSSEEDRSRTLGK